MLCESGFCGAHLTRQINDAGSGVVSDVVSIVSIDVPSRPRGLFATPVAVGFLRFGWRVRQSLQVTLVMAGA